MKKESIIGNKKEARNMSIKYNVMIQKKKNGM